MAKDKRKYSDRPETIKANVVRRRQNIKLRAVEYKGGKCSICSYDKCIAAMEFHHMNPLEKDFSVSKKGACTSWDRVKVELDKCILVCANCHREIHEQLRSILQ
jgi:5-methylcytosine-specific restriction endonuclease McrA